jgi:hypothetical protein
MKGHPIGSRETKEDEDLYKKADRILTNEFELSDAWVEDETEEENDEINSSDTSETLIQTKPRSDVPGGSDISGEDGFGNVNITQKRKRRIAGNRRRSWEFGRSFIGKRIL